MDGSGLLSAVSIQIRRCNLAWVIAILRLMLTRPAISLF
jgi:hypothetical protein